MKTGRRALARALMLVPKPLVWHFARTYIAGETIDDAIKVIRGLNGEGSRATVDVLGEDVADEREVAHFVDAYRLAIEAIDREGLDSNVSVKPTAMGLKISPECARRSMQEILRAAGRHGMFVRMDMEDSSTTTTTLELYESLREEGLLNVGVVLQAYLRRTLADAQRIAGAGGRVRLVKGIYVEPRALAHQEYDTVREAYVAALEILLAAPRCHVAIATHDEWLVVNARRLLRRYDVPPDRYEFQMLLGVDPQLRHVLVAEGHPMRIYVPYGQGWHGYSVRRLLENPSFASHVVKNVLGFGPGREDRAR
jgi:proline dehydrogenase